jgi:cytosine/creatinine deaminase
MLVIAPAVPETFLPEAEDGLCPHGSPLLWKSLRSAISMFCSSFQASPYNSRTMSSSDYSAMLEVAIAEARKGLAEGGIPIGAAIFDGSGKLVGAGHNRRVQNGDPSLHGETDAFRNAGRQGGYRKLIMVTTLAPCWYCSGLVRQFGFSTVIVGESRNFQGGVDWLRSLGVKVIDLDSQECVSLLREYIRANPAVWNEDIGLG